MTRLRARLANQRGITLLETLIAIGIMTMALTMVGMPLAAALRQDDDWRADITATTTLQRTAGWVGRDSVNARTASIGDGAPAADTLTLDWTDLALASHTAVYALSGTDLVRTFDGVALVIARGVTLVEFSRVANMMTFTLTVTAAAGETSTKTTTYLLRALG